MSASLSRRRFLALCGVAAPGLWLGGRGLIQLPGRMVLALAGECSFCGSSGAAVKGLAGVVGRPPRICDECISLCFAIIAEEMDRERQGDGAFPEPSRDPVPQHAVDELEEALRDALADQRMDQAHADQLLASVRRTLDGPPPPPRYHQPLACSFCDRPQKEVRKLIAGPTVYICDGCSADAGALFSHVLRG